MERRFYLACLTAVAVAAVLAAPAVFSQQSVPVYVTSSAPVAGSACSGPRVWLTLANPSVAWCCISSKWVQCEATGATTATPCGPGQFLTSDGGIFCASEADPKVGRVDVAGKWCSSDGTKIQCLETAPVLVEVDPHQPGSSCAASNYATGISSTGILSCSTVPAPAALAANGTNCSASQAATGVDSAGNAEGCWTPAAPANCGAGYVETGNGTAHSCTNTVANATSASTATALASNGSNCTAGQAALGVNESGAAEECWSVPMPANCAVGYVETGNGSAHSCTNWVDQAGWASTADEAAYLTNVPTTCSAGQCAQGINSSGNALGCITPLTAESDPKISSVSPGKWCVGTAGYQITCGANAPASPATCSAGYVETGNGTSHSCTNVIATASALAANGSNCTGTQLAVGVDAAGAAECTSTIVASDVACSSTCVADAEIAGVGLTKVSGWPTCGANTFLKSSGTTPTCVAIPTVNGVVPRTCPAGQYVSGINSDGTVACTAFSWSCSPGNAMKAISGTTATCGGLTGGGCNCSF